MVHGPDRAEIFSHRLALSSWLDKVLADRRWLLLLPLLGVRQRLRRLGVEAWRMRVWLIATALGGMAIWFVMRAGETDRAHRPVDERRARPRRVKGLVRADAVSTASAVD